MPPLSLSGLAAWYDISRVTGLIDGQNFVTVPDFSGNGHTLAHNAGFDPLPLYKTNQIKGLPVAWIDNTIAYNMVAASTLTQPFRLYAAVQWRSAPSGNQRWILTKAGAGQIDIGSNAAGKHHIFAGTSLDEASATIDTGVHVWNMLFNGASSDIRIDGTSVVSGDAGTRGPSEFGLGRSAASTLGPVSVGEWFYVSGSTNSVGAEHYLASRWL